MDLVVNLLLTRAEVEKKQSAEYRHQQRDGNGQPTFEFTHEFRFLAGILPRRLAIIHEDGARLVTLLQHSKRTGFTGHWLDFPMVPVVLGGRIRWWRRLCTFTRYVRTATMVESHLMPPALIHPHCSRSVRVQPRSR